MMWDLDTIRAMNAEAGRKARRTRPFRLKTQEQIDAMPPFPFPNVGDRSNDYDEKYERIDSLFCDSSGFGSSYEPALTPDQLKTRLSKLLQGHGTLLLAIESTGQFQVYVGVWKPRPRAKKVKNG